MSATAEKPRLMRLIEHERALNFEQTAREMTRAGMTDRQIAKHFGISLQCYKTWRKNVLKLRSQVTRELVPFD